MCSSGDSIRVIARDAESRISISDGSAGNDSGNQARSRAGSGSADSYVDLVPAEAAGNGGGQAIPASDELVSQQTTKRVLVPGFDAWGNGLMQWAAVQDPNRSMLLLPGVDAMPDVTPMQGVPLMNRPNNPDPTAVAAPAVPQVNVTEVARQAVARLSVPESQLGIDPSPDANEWNAAAVGEQLWLWTPETLNRSEHVSSEGIDIAITAAPGPLVIDMGDGHRVSCTRTDRLVGPFRNQPSPSCGHVYQSKGVYTVTATRSWQVQWSALGQSGTESLVRPAAQHQLNVIELHSLLVPGG